MGKVAFVFPGQGSQYVGMGYDFYKEFAEAADVFHSAETALRYNLSQIIFKGPEEELNRTINTQPAILTTSLAIYAVLKAQGFPVPDFVAGHSLGEYTALAVAGGVELFEAVRLAHLRGKYMQEAVPEGNGHVIGTTVGGYKERTGPYKAWQFKYICGTCKVVGGQRVILEKLFVYILFKGSPSKHNYGPCAFLDFFNYLSQQP